MFNFKYLIASAAVVLSTSAFAGGPEINQAPINNNGFYASGFGGANLEIMNPYNPYHPLGWNAGGAVGYHWTHWRLEVASDYSQNPRSHTFIQEWNGVFPHHTFGNLSTLSAMLNVYYDFHLGNFIPYVGLGLGWQGVWGDLWSFTQSSNNNIMSFTPIYPHNRIFSTLGVQGIVGLDYKITDHVRLGVSLRTGFVYQNQLNVGLSYSF